MVRKKPPQKKDMMGRSLLVGLATLIGIVGLVFSVETKDSTLIKEVLFCWLTTGLFLAVLVTSLFNGEIMLPRSKVMLPLGAYLCLAVVSTLLSRYKYASLHELTSLFCAVMLFFITVRAVTDRKAFFLVVAMVAVVAAISCLYGIAQHYDFDPVLGDRAVLAEQGRVFSTMGHPNFFASFLILALLILLSVFCWSPSGMAKVAGMVLICAAILCLFYTGSRGAWLGLLGGLPGWFLLSIASKRMRWIAFGPVVLVAGAMVLLLLTEGARAYVILWASPFWVLAILLSRILGGERGVRFAGSQAWMALLLVAIITVSNVFVDREKVGGRMESAFETEKGSVFARKVMWAGTLNMLKARPILGWGLGTFSIYFPRFRDPAIAGKIMPNTLHAHSEYLEVGAEMGMAGLAVFLWLIGAFLWESVQNASRSRREWQRLAIAGLVAGCMGLLLQAAVSVSPRWVVGRFFLWLGMGLTIAVGKMRPSELHARTCHDKGESMPQTRSAFYCISMRPLQAPVVRVSVLVLVAAVLVLAGRRGVRVFASAVLTKQGEGYQDAAEEVSLVDWGETRVVNSLGKRRRLRREAIECYERAIELNPYNLSAFYKLGHCYNLQGQLEDSLRTYREMAKLAPDGSDIHFNLGVVYGNMGRWEESRKELETALSMKIGPLSRLALARAYENLGRFGKAEELYRAMLAADRRDVRAMNGLGRLYLRAGDNEKAMEFYEQVLAIEPKNAEACLDVGLIHQTLGDRLREMGNEEKARQHYTNGMNALEIALRERPGNVPTRAALALLYADIGRFQDALAQLRQAESIKANQPVVHLNLGKVYLRMGEPDRAAAAFQRTMRIDPKGPWGNEAIRELRNMGLGGRGEAAQ